MIFTKSNPNPVQKKAPDCAVRSVVHGTGKSWDVVYKELCEIGFALKTMPNSKEALEKCLADNGWTKHKMPRKADNTKYTVREWADKNKGTTLIVQVANHFTCVKDGELLDTWNCSQKSVYNYYSKI